MPVMIYLLKTEEKSTVLSLLFPTGNMVCL